MPNFCINFLNKAEKSLPILYDFAVAPLTGAWIKTSEAGVSIRRCCVAPLTGAWIKTTIAIANSIPTNMSHPSRVRGLKQEIFIATYERTYVAPLTGAWIKTLRFVISLIGLACRIPAGAWIKTFRRAGHCKN